MREKWIAPAPGGQDGTGFPRTEGALAARLRGLLALMVCLCLTLTLLPAPAQAAEAPTGSWTDRNNYDTGWYGDGNTNSFTISTAAELAGLAKLSQTNNFSGKTITLTADVDLSDHLWIPIGTSNALYRFAGTFYGGGHTVRGMIIDSKATYSGGLFNAVTGTIDGLRIENASITLSYATPISVGILSGLLSDGAKVTNCAVSGNLDLNSNTGSPTLSYVGGLVGVGYTGTTIENCSAYLTTIKGSFGGVHLGGILGGSPQQGVVVENCVVSVDRMSVTAATVKTEFRLSPVARNSYWRDDTALGDADSVSYDNCYPVTVAQAEGTASEPIGSGSFANTTSLVDALNSWVTEKNKLNSGVYQSWTMADLADFLPPEYIDISGPLDEVTHQSATGDIDVGMDLEGQVQENVTLLSVTMPASIPFIVDVDGAGAFKRVLSATGTLSNRSDVGVNITLTAVTDEGKLLDKVALSLIPDPAPGAEKPQIALTKGDGKTDLLAALAVPTEGVPTTATVQVDGTDKLDGASIGSDGDAFVVGLTLKVSKQ